MNSFEYHNPVKLFYGIGGTDKIGEYIKAYGSRAMIVSYTEVGFYGNLFDRIHAKLKENGVSYVDYFGATANPKICEAKAGVELGKAEKVDCIIGVGGGSAMDLSKVIAAGILYPQDDIKRMIKFTHSADYQILPVKALPMLMLPTLPATSSEMNPTAVITDEETSRKSYVWEPACLYPKVSILDPALTVTLPPYQTACGGVDAISHVVEPFFFSDEATFGNIDLHDHIQIGVIQAIYENIQKVLDNPKDLQLRGLMQFSATVGLNGWLTCGVQGWTPMHQMGHVLSSHFNATHGATLSCMMLAWMRYFATQKQNERFVKFARIMFGTEDLLKAADIFEAKIKSFKIETRISEFGCTQADVERLTQGVVDVSFSSDGTLASIPPITRDDALAIYRLAL
jgi:alcohol dehydrogenase YqhD (iron-dependent ADH family)